MVNKNAGRDVSVKYLKSTSWKGWFTLVELIVVITILAILWTIAFISFQWYSRDARNSKRTSDLSNMQKVLSLYYTTNWEYPEPTNGEQVTFSGSEVWTQGTFWETVRQQLWSKAQISEVPYDPLTYNKYTYSVLNTKKEYQLAWVYEWEDITKLNINNKTYAAGEYGTTKVVWDYNWKVAKTQTWWVIYVLAIPSIISWDINIRDILDIIRLKKLVFNRSKILPSSYSWQTRFIEKQPDWNIVNTWSFIVYSSWNLDWLIDETNQQIFINNLAQAYICWYDVDNIFADYFYRTSADNIWQLLTMWIRIKNIPTGTQHSNLFSYYTYLKVR